VPRELSDATPKRYRRPLVLSLLLVLIALAYVFIASAGRIVDWPTQTTFLDDLVEGFRQGHLHMAVEPPAALLAKSNPFDPSYRPLWYWDASLYKGHYYLYWGPTPALLLAAFKILFRIKTQIGDQYPVYALALLQTVAGALLVDRISRRMFTGVTLRWVALAVVVFALATPATYNLARPAVYEAAIVGGQAFSLLGLLFAFDAVARAVAGEEPGRWRLALAGSCWAFALGSRISIALAFPPILLATAWFAVPPGPAPWRRRMAALVWVSAPVALGVFGLLAYNKLRFTSWFDFGRVYQMTWLTFTASPAFFLPNVYSYALRPLLYACEFPFLFVPQDMPHAFPKWFPLPPGYHVGEPLAGLLVTTPWTWLGPLAAAIGSRRIWRVLRAKEAPPPATRLMLWFVLCAGCFGVLAMAGGLVLLTGTLRYLGDVAGMFVLLGTAGAWWLRDRFRGQVWRRRAIDAGVIAAAIATIVVGLALGFLGQYGFFRLYNPKLMDKLEAKFSVCQAKTPVSARKR
jgi:hypothetical protein